MIYVRKHSQDDANSEHVCINAKKNCQFKTRCTGDKSNIENSTDHFCEDTRQNALAALKNLGHMTPFLLLGPSPFDDTMGERSHFTGQQADYLIYCGQAAV